MKMGLKLRIIIGFLPIAVLLAFIFIYYAYIISVSNVEISKWIGVEYLIEGDRDAYQSNIALSYLFDKKTFGDEKIREKEIENVKTNAEQVKLRFDKFYEVYLKSSNERNQDIDNFASYYKLWLNDTGELLNLLNKNRVEEARDFYFEKYQASFSTMRGCIDNITGVVTEMGYEKNKLIGAIARNISFISTTLLIVITLIIIVIGFLQANLISKPIFNLTKLLSSGSLEISSASEQLSRASQEISNGATEQAATIQETSASMEELSSMVKQNFENSQESSLLVVKTSEITENGYSEMENMLESMNAINKSSDDIKNVIDVIEDISFQTNMLALNAAVEAARAGEAGMGFAVVADEVKSLANRSSDNAKEISKMIKESIKRTEEGVEKAQKLSEIFKEILSNVKKVTEMSKEIELASKQQDIGIGQVNKAVIQFDSVVQSNAAGAEETASSAEELQSQVESLNEIVDSLITLVTGKKNDVSSVDMKKNIKNIQIKEPNRDKKKLITVETPKKRISFENDEDFMDM